METVFPFGFPAATAGYLALYVLTFALHQFFMHYVLAGTLYIGWCSLFPGNGTPRGEQPLAALIREWLPLLLSAAITAGVAPLLFVQIVYPTQFYTANLLLSWKWMIVVPLLIVAFYLLYLLKSKIFTRWPLAARAAITVATAASFVFIGFCWTVNHLLGNNTAAWPDVYSSGQLNLNTVEILARMFIWIGGSFASLSVFTAWQLHRKESLPGHEVSRMASMGMGGTVLSVCSALVYLWLIGAESRGVLIGALGLPYLLAGLAGATMQLFGWWKVLASKSITIKWLIPISTGLLLSLLGVSVARETLRLQSLDLTSLFARHTEASEIGGLTVFILFAAVNGLLIAFCIWLVIPINRQQNNEKAEITAN